MYYNKHKYNYLRHGGNILAGKNRFLSEEETEKQKEYAERVRRISAEFEQSHGRKPRFFSATYGCQQNENDTERLDGMLLQMGYECSDDKDGADLILFNTCAVREHAETKVFGNVGALVKNKRENPEMKICLCGCMVTQPHIADLIKTKYRHVDIVFGTHALYRFPENLFKALTGGKRVFDVTEEDGRIAEGLPVNRRDKVKAWVSIMSGCNNFCSYCIVPYVRGRERSRLPEKVLEEVRGLVADGYKEITLLGQNVNSYCKDLDIGYDFADLLRDINAISGDFTVKFMTSHPKDATEKLIDTIAECDKICKHLHLPVQSGSDDILKKMNRRYTVEKYVSLIGYAKQKIPNVAITSDIIVGFPGETEEDFRKTLDLVRKVEYNGLFTFIFSPRKGTPAAEMKEQIPQEVKKERFNRLLELQNAISTAKNSEFVGKVFEATVDGFAENSETAMLARTSNNTIVKFETNGRSFAEGDRVTLKGVRCANWAVYADIAD